MDRNNTGIKFFNFLYFFWSFPAQVGKLQNSGLKFFSVFLGLSYPVLAKNNAAKRFFCYFFQNFLARVEYERSLGLKFFFLFLGLSNPVLAKNNAAKRFFNFFISFSIFFIIFLPGSSLNGIQD